MESLLCLHLEQGTNTKGIETLNFHGEISAKLHANLNVFFFLSNYLI